MKVYWNDPSFINSGWVKVTRIDDYNETDSAHEDSACIDIKPEKGKVLGAYLPELSLRPLPLDKAELRNKYDELFSQIEEISTKMRRISELLISRV